MTGNPRKNVTDEDRGTTNEPKTRWERVRHLVKRFKAPSTEVAVAAAIIALISAAISLATFTVNMKQENLTAQQNDNSERQELVMLVTDITQEPNNMAQAAESIKNNRNLLNTVDSNILLSELAEGEEAYAIIQKLPGADVSSVEWYQAGVALLAGNDDNDALTAFENAANAHSDPRTEADALRNAAQIHYELGENSKAIVDIDRALGSFYTPGVTKVANENNMAYTEFFDIPYQVKLRCSNALAEWQQANLTASYPGVESPTLEVAKTNAEDSLMTRCHESSQVLNRPVG